MENDDSEAALYQLYEALSIAPENQTARQLEKTIVTQIDVQWRERKDSSSSIPAHSVAGADEAMTWGHTEPTEIRPRRPRRSRAKRVLVACLVVGSLAAVGIGLWLASQPVVPVVALEPVSSGTETAAAPTVPGSLDTEADEEFPEPPNSSTDTTSVAEPTVEEQVPVSSTATTSAPAVTPSMDEALRTTSVPATAVASSSVPSAPPPPTSGAREEIPVPVPPPPEPVASGVGTVEVLSTPSASVSLDGELVGVTPLTLEASTGVHEILLVSESGARWVRELKVEAGEKHTLSAAMNIVGAISVTSEIWASVSLDGSPFKPTPAYFRNVPAGRHRVRAVRDGYEDQLMEVDVEAGRTSTVRLTMVPEP